MKRVWVYSGGAATADHRSKDRGSVLNVDGGCTPWRRDAFTTLELLVATALAALLMVGVLHVTASIRPPHDHDRAGSVNGGWTRHLVQQLTWDLTNARTLELGENQVTLTGYSFLNKPGTRSRRRGQRSASSSHQPVRVAYVLRGRWLVRQQTNLSELTNRNTVSTLLCGNVTGFEIQTADESVIPTGPLGGATQDGPVPIPNTVRLVMAWMDNEAARDASPRRLDQEIVIP